MQGRKRPQDRIEFSPDYSRDKLEFAAQEQGGWKSVDGKLLRGKRHHR